MCPSGKGSGLENRLSEMACGFKSYRWRFWCPDHNFLNSKPEKFGGGIGKRGILHSYPYDVAGHSLNGGVHDWGASE